MYVIWVYIISCYRYANVTLLKQELIPACMADDNYVGVRLPRELIDDVDHLIEKRVMGFRSRAEFIADAIRRRLEQIPPMEKTSKKGK